MKTKELVAIVAIITLLSSSVCLILQDDSYADLEGADDVGMSEPYYIVTVDGSSTTHQVPCVKINSNTDEKAYCLEDRKENGGDGELYDEYGSSQSSIKYSYYRIFDDVKYKGADIELVIPEGTTLCLVNEFINRDVRVEFGAEIGSISIYGGGSLDANPKDADTNGKRDEVGFNGVPTTITGITLLPAANSVVYGGSVTKGIGTMEAVDLDSTNLILRNVTFGGMTYAGSLAGDVGSSSLKMIDVHITAKKSAYGGNAEAGQVGSTDVVFDGGNIDNVYGGGNNSNTSCGSTNLNVLGGTVNTVYGGGSNSPTSHTFVHVGNDAEVTNHVFGGGYNGDSLTTEVAVDGGSILGSVYGGCNSADVIEDAYITISGGEIGQGVLAGGSFGAVTNVANAHIAVTGGTIGYGVPSGDDTEADMTRGIFAAGGNAKNHGTVTNVEIVITGGTIYDVTESEAYNPNHPENIGKGEHAASPSSSSIRVSGGSFANDISDVITDGYVIQNADGSYSVSDNPPFIPGWDDDDEYIPPIVPVQPEDSGDDSVTVVACAAAAVVAALMAAFLILDRKR